MKRGRPSGWQINSAGGLWPVIEAGGSRWEKMLTRHAVEESQVISLLKSGTDQGRLIRGWIAQNRDSAFIPLRVLEAINVSTRWDS